MKTISPEFMPTFDRYIQDRVQVACINAGNRSFESFDAITQQRLIGLAKVVHLRRPNILKELQIYKVHYTLTDYANKLGLRFGLGLSSITPANPLS